MRIEKKVMSADGRKNLPTAGLDKLGNKKEKNQTFSAEYFALERIFACENMEILKMLPADSCNHRILR
jgi:hypothetical protein